MKNLYFLFVLVLIAACQAQTVPITNPVFNGQVIVSNGSGNIFSVGNNTPSNNTPIDFEPIFYSSSNIAKELRLSGTMVNTANNDNLYMIATGGTITASASFSNVNFYHEDLGTPALTGSVVLANSYQLYIAQAPVATNTYGIYQAGTDKNVLNNLTLTSGGGGAITFADGTIQTTAASGSGSSLVTKIVAGSGISISPNTGTGIVTINTTGIATAGVTSISTGTGITANASTGPIQLTNTGVTSLNSGSGISVSGSTGTIQIANTGVTGLTAGTNITLSGSTGNVTISANTSGTYAPIASPTFTGTVTLPGGTTSNSASGTRFNQAATFVGSPYSAYFTGTITGQAASFSGTTSLASGAVSVTTNSINISNSAIGGYAGLLRTNSSNYVQTATASSGVAYNNTSGVISLDSTYAPTFASMTLNGAGTSFGGQPMGLVVNSLLTGTSTGLDVYPQFTDDPYGDIFAGERIGGSFTATHTGSLYFGLYLSTPTISSGSGTFSNTYQLYINSGLAGTSNTYGIYQQGANPNSFNGTIQSPSIGVGTTPSGTSGDLNVGTSLEVNIAHASNIGVSLAPAISTVNNSAKGLRVDPTITATANGDSLYQQVIGGNINTAGYTGITDATLYLNGDGGTTTGVGLSYLLYLASATPSYGGHYGIYQIGTDPNLFSGIIIQAHSVVASLPSASSNKYGEAFVSDATQAPGTSLGSAVTGGGSYVRKVYSDGTNWLLE